MEKSHSETLWKQLPPVKPRKDVAFDAYITFRALGGMIMSDDGVVTRMTLEDFCQQYDVDRRTTWRWKQTIPDLDEKIRERREQIAPSARASAMWNQLFLLGMQTQDKRAAVDAAKTWLGHYEGLRLPSQQVKHEVGNGLAELVTKARLAQQNQDSQEVIDVDPEPNNT